MKDFIVLLVILMCIIGMGMWQVSYLGESSNYIKTDLAYIDYYINLEKYKEAEQEIKRVENTWDSIKDTWGLFIHHEDIEYIEIAIDQIKSYIKDEAKEDARAEIAGLISNIDYTVECEKIKLENIF